MSKKEQPAQSTDDRYQRHKSAISDMTGDFLADRRQRGDYKTTEEQARKAVMDGTKKVRREAGEE